MSNLAVSHTLGGVRATKEYVAVVIGWPEWDAITIDADIESHPCSSFKMCVATTPPTLPETAVHTPNVTTPQMHATSDNPSGCTASAFTNESHEENCSARDLQRGTAVVMPANVVNDNVAARWGPSRMPPAPRWERDGRAARRRNAKTQARVLRRGLCTLAGPLRHQRVSLMQLVPHTGRRHQLRVHLASLGHPLLGDVAYAGDLSTHRLCLHAQAITFTYSDDGNAEESCASVLPPSGVRIGSDVTSGTPFDAFVTETQNGVV